MTPAEQSPIVLEYATLVNILLKKANGKLVIKQSELVGLHELKDFMVIFDASSRSLIYQFTPDNN